MFNVSLIMQPTIDLGRFSKLINSVNAIDASRLPPHRKFGEAVDELLQEQAYGDKHLFYGFYFEMPFTTMLEAENFPYYSYFRLTVKVDTIICKGIMTGPLDLWRQFCAWGNEHHSITAFVQALEKQLPCR